MDTIIEAEVTARRKKKIGLIVFLFLVLLITTGWLLRLFLSTEIKSAAVTTAVVEKGDVENTITASGIVLPEFEETITSPINASIQKVLLDAGNEVKTGESVLLLDKTAT